MGITKRYLECGFYPSGQSVCAQCFEDYAIKKFIIKHAVKNECDYCGLRNDNQAIASSVDAVKTLIIESIQNEWSCPSDECFAAGLGDADEIDGITADELIEILLPEFSDCETKLGSEVIEMIGNMNSEWCLRNYYSGQYDDWLIESWNTFCEEVKHRKRYVFYQYYARKEADRTSYDRPPHNILNDLDRFANQLKLVKPITKATKVYRARIGYRSYTTAEELGTPPPSAAKYSNRMSPAGIPMFYASMDPDTAEEETKKANTGSDKLITIATFEVIEKFHVLDLTSIPSIPSIFDDEMREMRSTLVFLDYFRRDLSQPITKDGREHVDYVPTQVMTEHFRYLFKDTMGDRIEGIIYPSSINNGQSCVFFFRNEDCIEMEKDKIDVSLGRKQWLQLLDRYTKQLT